MLNKNFKGFLTGVVGCAAALLWLPPGARADAQAEPLSAMTALNPMERGALGTYPVSREASGTAWQPDSSSHAGLMQMPGDWMLMEHGRLDGVYDWQQGPRGGESAFLSGMLMGMANRHFGAGDALQFRSMLSPDPLMGKSGYPLLLQTGETANGTTPLEDRQHPHNLFMEMSGSFSHAWAPLDSAFVYAGLPAEPAFGPPAFMHRESGLDDPQAPITHHWLDSTHVTFGVMTVGWVHDTWKLETSRFRGREPDQYRDNIQVGALDSASARLSWNPVRDLSLQASWAHLVSPEQLQPLENQTRLSVSALYTKPLALGVIWATTLAWGERHGTGGPALHAGLLESSVKWTRWTVFARAEEEQNNELDRTVVASQQVNSVGKVSLGALREVYVTSDTALGVGALYAVNEVPQTLAASYGRTDPSGAMLFVRLKIQ